MWEQVIRRDALIIWEGWGLDKFSSFEAWLSLRPLICVVGFLSPPGSVKCFGKQTVEHVKDQMLVGEPIVKRRQIRAKSDVRHLVACCWGHNAFSPPTQDMRYKLRSWLRRVNQ